MAKVLEVLQWFFGKSDDAIVKVNPSEATGRSEFRTDGLDQNLR